MVAKPPSLACRSWDEFVDACMLAGTESLNAKPERARMVCNRYVSWCASRVHPVNSIYIYTYLHTSIHTYIHIYIYTHIYIYIFSVLFQIHFFPLPCLIHGVYVDVHAQLAAETLLHQSMGQNCPIYLTPVKRAII